MSLKPPSQFSIFCPKPPGPRGPPRAVTVIRFSRWNNANAQKFIRRQRSQQDIEDDIRRLRRFDSASAIALVPNSSPAAAAHENPQFKSVGTPSSPSPPSIPPKSSKYSKPNPDHPAFRHASPKRSRVPVRHATHTGLVTMGDNGIAYRLPDAPFEFQYSYTETPKVKPLALREQPYLPFGPSTMPRPWTGRAPLPPSKKKLPDFDSFRLPPPHKKGVKPVQAPGPFVVGTGPKYAKTREEILGDPLTPEETKDLIRGTLKLKRQINMGRDGLTHNMLDNIHDHWKRRRVCKIKCKGVCTVDMDNVCKQLEEKTGGKIIYKRGGVLHLFRGRNYNYRTRPKFPLMLWKPITPVYPRLVQRAPAGLTLEEASEMRKRGGKLPPICKLAKNGVYSDIVKNVREAFEVCDLVRINCQGLNKSDFKKIGGKLKDLVPCVLLSFKDEHILIWRGRDWNSSYPKPEDEYKDSTEFTVDSESVSAPSAANSILVTHAASELDVEESSESDDCSEIRDQIPMNGDVDLLEETKDPIHLEKNINQPSDTQVGHISVGGNGSSTILDAVMSSDAEMTSQNSVAVDSETAEGTHEPHWPELANRDPSLAVALEDGQCPDHSAPSIASCQSESTTTMSNLACTEGVLLLWRQAIDSGSALVLDNDSLDPNIVYERAVVLAKTAPPGPVFKNRFSKIVVEKSKKSHESSSLEEISLSLLEKENIQKSSKGEKKSSKGLSKNFTFEHSDVVPHGSLRVDELAKLLA